MRRLIINADDFGMTYGVNRAITETHRAGVVTSATLMANESAVDDAITIASENPSLGIGCHVVLVDGVPVSEPDSVQSLIGLRNGNDVRFRPGIAHLALAAVSGKVSEGEVHAEAAAQIQRLQSRRLTLSHVDCHMHSHILPLLARGVLRAARDYGIQAVRVVDVMPDGTWELVTHPGYNDHELSQARTELKQSRMIELELLRAPDTLELLRRRDVQLINYREL